VNWAEAEPDKSRNAMNTWMNRGGIRRRRPAATWSLDISTSEREIRSTTAVYVNFLTVYVNGT